MSTNDFSQENPSKRKILSSKYNQGDRKFSWEENNNTQYLVENNDEENIDQKIFYKKALLSYDQKIGYTLLSLMAITFVIFLINITSHVGVSPIITSGVVTLIFNVLLTYNLKEQNKTVNEIRILNNSTIHDENNEIQESDYYTIESTQKNNLNKNDQLKIVKKSLKEISKDYPEANIISDLLNTPHLMSRESYKTVQSCAQELSHSYDSLKEVRILHKNNLEVEESFKELVDLIVKRCTIIRKEIEEELFREIKSTDQYIKNTLHET